MDFVIWRDLTDKEKEQLAAGTYVIITGVRCKGGSNVAYNLSNNKFELIETKPPKTVILRISRFDICQVVAPIVWDVAQIVVRIGPGNPEE